MNRTSLFRAVLAVAVMTATGCASSKAELKPSTAPAPAAKPAPPATTPDAAFRDAAPAPGPEVAFQAPKVERFTLKNGLKVDLVERHELPLVSLNLVLEDGRNADPRGKDGLAAFTAKMLDEGTTTRTAPQLAAAFEDLAIQYDAGAVLGTSVTKMSALTTSLDAALELFADVIQHPAFNLPDVERVRGERLSKLVASHDQPEQIARDVLLRSLYGKGPWGAPAIGTVTGLKAITRANLKKFHDTYYVPGNATLVVVGDVQPAALQAELEKHFSTWKNRKVAVPKDVAPAVRAQRSILLVDKPDAPQSQILFGQVLFPAKDADPIPFEVMNGVLGGLFSSRLNANLREGKGWSYGVYSYPQWTRAKSPWFSGGGFIADKTPQSVAELDKELVRMQTGVVTKEELAQSKNALVRSLTGFFDTNASTAWNLGRLIGLGLPADYYAGYSAKVAAVNDADIKRAAGYLTPAKMQIVVVGPKSLVQAPLEALELGPVELRDDMGAPVK